MSGFNAQSVGWAFTRPRRYLGWKRESSAHPYYCGPERVRSQDARPWPGSAEVLMSAHRGWYKPV